MNIEVISDKIKLTNTIASDIEMIVGFEKENSQFVGQYNMEQHLDLLKDPACLHLSIRRLSDDKLIGHILAFGLADINNVLEFRRIIINEKGKGYGRTAIKLLKKICFEELGYHRLWLDVFDDNERAIRLYESEGFTKEGLLRENIKTDDGYRSQRIYAIIKKEYNPENNLI